MIEIIGLHSLALANEPTTELLAALAAAGVSATVRGTGASGGEQSVEVWADCTEARAWQVIDGLQYAKAWDVEGEIPAGYRPGDKFV